jgi:anaerobic selenocysteine-containing dehydrogenase
VTATVHDTLCRLCAALCPISVTVEDGLVLDVGGDRQAPLYEGYTCPKGRALPELQASPGRLHHSLKKRADGRSHGQIRTALAVEEIADRLASIVETHGPNAVGLYVGTTVIAHPAMASTAASLLLALGSTRIYSAATIDQPGLPVAEALHGVWLGGATRFQEAEVLLYAGTNPIVSKQYITENPAKQLTRALERGVQLIVIDPRRTETARRAHVHLQARPGSDGIVVAGLLRQLFVESMIDDTFLESHVDGVEALRQAVEPFSPAYVAHHADIPEGDLFRAATILGHAQRGVIGGGTGVSMANPGPLVSYLLLCLTTLRGFWAREGDRIGKPNVLMPPNEAKAQAAAPFPGWQTSRNVRVRGLHESVAGPPTAGLAEEILTPGDGQIRVLFNVGGSPMMSWPDQRRTQEALESLDLFVTTEVELSPTARVADYVIATKTALETPGMTQVAEVIKYHHPGYGFSEPYARYAPAVVDPPDGSDLIEDWQLYYRIARRLSLPLNLIKTFGRRGGPVEAPMEIVALDMEHEPTTDDLFEAMCAGSSISLDEVKRYPHGHVFDELAERRVAPSEPTCRARLDVGNATMIEQLDAVSAVVRGPVDGSCPFVLIGRRENRVINSFGRSAPGLMRGRSHNPAFMHPADLEALSIAPGDAVVIRSEHDEINALAAADADLRRGVVSMSHGFGRNPGEAEDPATDGANTNRLIRADGDFDRITGMPRMGAIPVSVNAAQQPGATPSLS